MELVEPSDITVEILKSIRDEIRKTNERLDGTNERLESTNQRLDGTNERLESTNQRLDGTNERLDRLERRQTEAEVRVASELTAVAHAVRDLRDILLDRLDLRDEVKALERRLAELERRVGG
jgi:two-component system CheB/CheR fusion protein